MATQHSKRAKSTSLGSGQETTPHEKVRSTKNSVKEKGLSAAGIVRLIKHLQSLTPFQTPSGEPYARMWVKDHWENHPLKSPLFEEWLSATCYYEYGVAPSPTVTTAARRVFSADAKIRNDQRKVHVRLADHDGAIYLDLANDRWEAVKITGSGWEIVPHVPVRFWRPPGVQPLPNPKRGRTIADLRPFLNWADEDQWILFVSWLVGALCPRGPYPLLILEGVHGSGKSTTARVLRALVDPNSAPLRAEPHSTRDLMISAKNARCLGFDNLSSLSPSLSDALCRLSTGGGFSTRELYTNDGEKIFEGMRPILVNGIDMGIERMDLLDRAIYLSLPMILETSRETEADFWRRFNGAQPYILGSLLDAVVCAMRRLPDVETPCLPRMADFAKWICAAEPALGWREGGFLRALKRTRADSIALGLEASPLVQPIMRIAKRGQWQGTATELMGVLVSEQVNDPVGVQRIYPKSPRQLSQAIRRLIPSLTEMGIAIEFARTAGTNSERIISIRLTSSGKDCDDGDGATKG